MVMRSLPVYMRTKDVVVVDLSAEGLPEIPVLGDTHYTRRAKGTVPHIHPGMIEVLYCRRGAGMTLNHAGVEYPFCPDDIVVAQPDVPHFLSQFSRGFQMHWFWIRLPGPGKTMFRLSRAETTWLMERLAGLPVRFRADGEVRRAFRAVWRIYETVTDKGVRALRLREAMLHLLLSMVDVSERERAIRKDDALERVAAEMRAHPERAWPMTMLERRLAASAPKISVLFKRQTGLPPHAFLLACRVEAAKEALATTRRSIASIADGLGFATPQHFAMLFRRSVGMTPRRWRAEHFIESKKEDL